MVTIKDVAQDAGVSVGTVSNVINGGNVSEERRSRVEASIQKLGYQVNGLARGMRTQRTGYVVVMLPNITNPFYNMLLRDLEKALTGIGKQLVLCISDGDHKKEIKYIEMAKYNKVDGVIGVTFSNVEKYIEDSSAYVSIERCLPGVPCVSCDNYGGGWSGAEPKICCSFRQSVQWKTRCARDGMDLRRAVKRMMWRMAAYLFQNSRYQVFTRPFLQEI